MTKIYSLVKVQIDAAVHFDHVQIIRCDIKPGSVVRSIYRSIGMLTVFAIQFTSFIVYDILTVLRVPQDLS
jgi:hypothetical protein